jgi:hypothetical protein
MPFLLCIYAVIDIYPHRRPTNVPDILQANEIPMALGFDSSIVWYTAMLLDVRLWRMAFPVIIYGGYMEGYYTSGCGIYLLAPFYEKSLQPDYNRLVPISWC